MSDYIKSVGKMEVDVLVACMVRSVAVLEVAVHKVEVEDFNEVTELECKLIWDVTKSHYLRFREPITWKQLTGSIQSKAADQPELTPERLEKIYNVCKEIFETPKTDILPAYGLKLMEDFLMRRRVFDYAMQQAESQFVNVDIAEELIRRKQSAVVASANLVTPCDGNLMLGTLPRKRTGFQPLDSLMGGLRAPEVYGLIAPSGGGKTTLAHQIGSSYATIHTDEVVVIFSYEEPITSEYLVPMHACISGVTRKRLDVDEKDLAPEDRVKLERAMKGIGSRLIYADHSGSGTIRAGHGGVEEVEAVIKRLTKQGLKVGGIIIDWFYPLMTRRWATYAGKNMEQRNFAVQLLDEFKTMAANLDCWVWINHQVAAAEATKKRAVEWNDAAEFKAFSWFLNGCLTLSALDEAGICILNYSKARGAKTAKVTIQLKGEIARFVGLSGDYTSDRQGNYQKQGEARRIPGAVVEEVDDGANSVRV